MSNILGKKKKKGNPFKWEPNGRHTLFEKGMRELEEGHCCKKQLNKQASFFYDKRRMK